MFLWEIHIFNCRNTIYPKSLIQLSYIIIKYMIIVNYNITSRLFIYRTKIAGCLGQEDSQLPRLYQSKSVDVSVSIVGDGLAHSRM